MLTEVALMWCCVFTPDMEIPWVGLPPIQWEDFSSPIQSEGTGVSPQPER